MTFHRAIPGRRPASQLIGIWLGFLAITLHAFAPLVGAALPGAKSMPAPLAHDHAAHQHQHAPAAAAAEHAPPAPDLVCVGDCPCCSLGDRVLSPPCSGLLLLLPVDATAAAQPAVPIPPRVFHPGTHFPPRAPPFSA